MSTASNASEPGAREAPLGGHAVARRRAGAAVVLVVLSAMLFAGRVLETDLPRAELDLDQAWKVSLAERFERGEVAGRDFFYTYGPATQLVLWLATRLQTTPDVLASTPLADLVFVALNMVLLAVILLQFDLGAAASAFALLALALARIPEHYASFRTLLVALAALAAGAALASERRAPRIVLGVLAGVVVVIAQLVSADLLVLAALAVAAAVGFWVMLGLRRERQLGFPWSAGARQLLPSAMTVAAASAGTVVAGNLAVAAFAAGGSGGFGSYHRDLLDMIAGYGLTMGVDWQLGDGRTAALGLALVLLVVATTRSLGASTARERALLLALLGAAAVAARSAFTRSDVGHIALAFTPALVLLVVVASLELRRSRAVSAAAIYALLLMLASWPLADIGAAARSLGRSTRFHQVRERWSELRHAEVARPEVLRRAAVRRGSISRLGAARAELSGGAVAVVPWENHLAIALDAPQTGAILQAYAAHVPGAQSRWLEELRAESSAQVLLAVDHIGTRPLEGVLTPVRLPVIFRGLLEELEPAVSAASGAAFLLLERRPSPLRLGARELAVTRRSGDLDEGLELALEPEPCRLLALELEISYPPWVALGRPEPLALEVNAVGGPIVTTRVVALRDGAPFEILVPLISGERLGDLWSPSADPGPEPSAIRLRRDSQSLAAAPSRDEVVRRVSCLEW